MRKKKKSISQSSNRPLIYAFLIIFVLFAAASGLMYWLNSSRPMPVTGLNLSEINQPLDHSLVCMVNNAYMGTPQIPIPVNGKTYYGCCEMCVEKLNNTDDARIAIDPFSGKPVDKSEAYIILVNTRGEVAYFESEINAQKFSEK